MLKSESRVCVIGAGPCGLATLKNLLVQDIKNVVVFEKNNQLGGNWIYNENNRHSSVYETTHLISSKHLSSFEDFPMPDHYPDYPSHHQVLKYFQDYAAHFDLVSHIKFNTEVLAVNYKSALSHWELSYADENGDHTGIFDYVLVANGHHWSPFTPQYPGEFQGEILHAHSYKKAAPFKNKKVLIVGAGNSACDIAVDIARVASSTTVSTRQGQHIFPKFIFGKPTDVLYRKIAWLPFRVQQQLAKWVLRMVQGRYEKYQLPTPLNKPLSTHPTINSELLYFIRHGKIAIRGKIQCFDEDTVHFSDGTCETFDTVIFATGYIIEFPFFETSFLDYRQVQEIPLYLKMMHPELENLYFIGLFQPQGCIWPLADYQARLAAQIIAGKLERPANVLAEIQKESARSKHRFDSSPRHVPEVDCRRFRKQLLQELAK